MVRFAATVASICAVAVSLSGCGESGPTGLTTSSTQSPAASTTTRGGGAGSTGAPAPATTVPTTTTTDAPPGKTPLYVVMRMDDINPIDHADNQTDVMNWFADHNLKYNFGIIVGHRPADTTNYPIYWPTTCADNATGKFCDSKIVQRVNEAYNNGDVVGTGERAIFEIGNHAYDHEGWGEQWQGYVPNQDWPAYQANDLNLSTSILRQVYPKASIKYFAAPTNVADRHTLASLKSHGMEIISTAATMQCKQYPGSPMVREYLTSPCNVENNSVSPPIFTAECEPVNDTWATAEGFARVNDIVSAPAGAANTLWSGGGQVGITVDEAIGEDDCGCNKNEDGNEYCGLVPSAKNNALKSGGLHWSVMMMHPPTIFPSGQSYPEWLDDFYEKTQALKNYTVHFINFQDLAQMSAPGVPVENIAVV